MKKFALIAAMALAAALLLTACFGGMEPTPTQMPAVDPTDAPAPSPTDAPLMPSDAPLATVLPNASDLPDMPDATDGLNVAPSPSASTNP